MKTFSRFHKKEAKFYDIFQEGEHFPISIDNF